MNLEELMVTLSMLDITYCFDEKYLYIRSHGENFDNKVFLHRLLDDNNIKYSYEYLDRYWGGGYKIRKNFNMSLKDKIINYLRKCI